MEVDEPSRGGAKRKRGPPQPLKAPAKNPDEERVCFICFSEGSLISCDRRGCPKVYHPHCVNLDKSFAKGKTSWSCVWHSCSICDKPSQYMCYTCTYSLCKDCIRKAGLLCVRGKKGFCETCMNAVMRIETGAPGSQTDMETAEMNFEDKNSWGYLFKEYWLDLKGKLSLTLDELTRARNPLKASGALAIKEGSSYDPHDSSDDEDSSSDSSGGICDGSRSMETKGKSSKTSTGKGGLGKGGLANGLEDFGEGTSHSGNKEWASKDLLDFVAYMKDGDTSTLSRFDVQALLLGYVERNNLNDIHRKNQIKCDSRLKLLFGRARVGRFQMLKLLDSHIHVATEDFPNETSEVQTDTVGLHVKARGKGSSSKKKFSDKRHKFFRRIEDRRPLVNLDDFAAIDVHNINLIYLKRIMLEDLLGDVDNIQDKVVGSFVRIRVSDSGQKEDVYRLVPVIGIQAVAEGGSIAAIALEIQNLSNTEVISMDLISNQDLSEEECKNLSQNIKSGLIKILKVRDIQDKARALQKVRVKNWLDTEIVRLSNLRDRASEKGRKKELRESLEKLKLLSKPEERTRLLEELPVIHADPCMDPNYISDEDEGDPAKGLKYSRFSKGKELLSPSLGDEPNSLPTTDNNETDKIWHYQDPSEKIQGPFSMTQLRKWSKYGHFPNSLRIWKTSEKHEDSILLTDALNGTLLKDPAQWEAELNSFSQLLSGSMLPDGGGNQEGGWGAGWESKGKEKTDTGGDNQEGGWGAGWESKGKEKTDTGGDNQEGGWGAGWESKGKEKSDAGGDNQEGGWGAGWESKGEEKSDAGGDNQEGGWGAGWESKGKEKTDAGGDNQEGGWDAGWESKGKEKTDAGSSWNSGSGLSNDNTKLPNSDAWGNQTSRVNSLERWTGVSGAWDTSKCQTEGSALPDNSGENADEPSNTNMASRFHSSNQQSENFNSSKGWGTSAPDPKSAKVEWGAEKESRNDSSSWSATPKQCSSEWVVEQSAGNKWSAAPHEQTVSGWETIPKSGRNGEQTSTNVTDSEKGAAGWGCTPEKSAVVEWGNSTSMDVDLAVEAAVPLGDNVANLLSSATKPVGSLTQIPESNGEHGWADSSAKKSAACGSADTGWGTATPKESTDVGWEKVAVEENKNSGCGASIGNTNASWGTAQGSSDKGWEASSQNSGGWQNEQKDWDAPSGNSSGWGNEQKNAGGNTNRGQEASSWVSGGWNASSKNLSGWQDEQKGQEAPSRNMSGWGNEQKNAGGNSSKGQEAPSWNSGGWHASSKNSSGSGNDHKSTADETKNSGWGAEAGNLNTSWGTAQGNSDKGWEAPSRNTGGNTNEGWGAPSWNSNRSENEHNNAANENKNSGWGAPVDNTKGSWGTAARESSNKAWGNEQNSTGDASKGWEAPSWHSSGWGNEQKNAGGDTNKGRDASYWNSGGWGDDQKNTRDQFSGNRDRSFHAGGSAQVGGKWNRSTGDGGSAKPPRGPRVCKFYESGHCKKGTSCNFLHA